MMDNVEGPDVVSFTHPCRYISGFGIRAVTRYMRLQKPVNFVYSTDNAAHSYSKIYKLIVVNIVKKPVFIFFVSPKNKLSNT